MGSRAQIEPGSAPSRHSPGMKILVTTGPAHPLYFPIVPLAWALRAAGHQVIVATPENFGETVHQSGLPSVPVGGTVQMAQVMGTDRDGNRVQVPATDEEMAAGIGHGFGRLGARVIDDTCELVRQWRPDVILTEGYSVTVAAAAAALYDVPWIRHTVGPGDLDVDRWSAAELAPELAGLGVTDLPAPALVVDNCPPLLADPPADAQLLRYVPYGEPTAVPAWVFAERTRPRVLVTLGSVQPAIGGLPMLQQIITALGTLPADLIVAVADFLLPQLGQLPDSVVAAGWQSLTGVLPGCDLAVHHGGPGTMMACLNEGLPQVIVPGRGKPLAAIDRLAAFGAVTQIAPPALTPESVTSACQELLDDPSYGKRAVEVRDRIAELPSPPEVVRRIEDVLAGRRS